MNRVELRTAFHWHCDDCGADNFALPRKAELTDEDAESAYRKHHMLDKWEELPADWRDFEMVQIPSRVHCSHCGSMFDTENEAMQ